MKQVSPRTGTARIHELEIRQLRRAPLSEAPTPPARAASPLGK